MSSAALGWSGALIMAVLAGGCRKQEEKPDPSPRTVTVTYTAQDRGQLCVTQETENASLDIRIKAYCISGRDKFLKHLCRVRKDGGVIVVNATTIWSELRLDPKLTECGFMVSVCNISVPPGSYELRFGDASTQIQVPLASSSAVPAVRPKPVCVNSMGRVTESPGGG